MPKIIISYRRRDSDAITGRIFDRLVAHYGRDAVFCDIDNIPPGIDFRAHIADALHQSDILLAIVGPKWAGRSTRARPARIDDDNDFVRIEIETALQRGIPVIPVLLGNTKMPGASQVPESLKDFVFRNAVKVDPGRDFDHHLERLTREMDQMLNQGADVAAMIGSPSKTDELPALRLPDKPSITVLPFSNLGGDPEQEYFADGMVEEITTALSRVRSLFVIACNSSFTYKSRTVDIKQVGRELGVRYVLEGSVRKAGARVRIITQLVDAATGSHVWAERYDRGLADIFLVQDEITERVVAAVEPELYAAEYFRSQRDPPESLDAWGCVIRALALVGQVTRVGLAEAESLSRRAIAIAPGYGKAHGLLAWILARRPLWSGDISSVLPEAAAEVQTALRCDERDPWAHMAHGVVLFRMRRFGESERAIRRALEFNPNFALGHAQLGTPLAANGAHEEALKSAENALRLSPRDRLIDTVASVVIANAYFVAGRYADCMTWARKTIEKYPDEPRAPHILIAAAAMQSDMNTASDALTNLLQRQPDFSLAWVRETTMFSGEFGERFLEGLRKAGVPAR